VLAVDVTTAVIEVSGVPTLVVEGVIDLATVAELRDALTRLLREHPHDTVVVDLDGAAAIDDVGLGVLLGMAGRARADGGDIDIVCTRPALREQFAQTRLDRALTIRSTVGRSTVDR
jgi:anti-sigma B factor antagonist